MTLRLRLLAAALLALACAPPATAARPPEGISSNKVLVIGLDGVRWDKLQAAIATGAAPNLRTLARFGIAAPTLLPYGPPDAPTISSVGWSTIATGVGPAKHGVAGPTNSDLDQAEKNGYPDFLTRLEQVDPKFGTLLASDWANIGGQTGGGPIFGYDVDIRRVFYSRNPAEFERDDARVAALASLYLGEGNPDAAFVYFGLVDVIAHSSGSATPAYANAIAKTDRQIGRLLDAIRERRRYAQERWTVIVTTDHGQLDLAEPSLASHGGGSEIERTSFVIAAGPGVAAGIRPGVLDIAPTVFHQLGVFGDPAWGLDGRSFVTAAPPPPPDPPAGRARLGGTRDRPTLTLAITRGRRNATLRSVEFVLPRGLSIARTRARRGHRRLLLRARADSIPIPARRTIVTGPRTIETATSRGRKRIYLSLRAGSLELSRELRRRLLRGARVVVRARVVDTTDEHTESRIRVRLYSAR